MESNDLKKIERYIRGQSDDDERKFVESLFANGQNNLLLRELLRQDWESIKAIDSKNQFIEEKLLNEIHGKIWESQLRKYKRPAYRLSRAYNRVAAILLLPVLAIGIILYFHMKGSSKGILKDATFSVNAPLGSRISFELPDGTIGMLNGGSKLEYSLPFRQREVKLDGEAWFEVKHDESHPFEIRANNSIIEVLGTKLNVSAYHEENYLEVVLEEGKVDFYKDNSTEKISLKPSERLVLRNGELKKSIVETARYISWTQGKLIFRGDSMPEVARQIERWYNVKVNIADKELEKYSFRATFQDDPLEEVIRCIALTSPITYKITPRKLSDNGIYEKTEVILYKNN